MQLISRALTVLLLLAIALALPGCQTQPVTPAQPAAGAARAAPTVEFFVAQSRAAEGLTAAQTADGVIYLRQPAALGRADLTDAAALRDRQGQSFVGLRFTPEGARKLSEISRNNVGDMLALVIGGELVAAPKITQALERGALSFGVPSAQAAASIAARIRGDAPAAK